ncbi:hypothetical protein [Vulgatibacter sp.]|uniref:hypothetical protein n=1 Tax=Vulgatibacter sp. TaxID=1971226 RepID=UPI003568DCB9
MRLKVCYHDNCFDGLASAATFTRFYKERIDASAEVTYQGLAHRAGDAFGPNLFDGDVNAIVDFRYTQNPGLTWFFDHHISAFQEPGDEAHFRADHTGRKFWDPQAKSCTKFLAKIATERFGWDAGPMRELIDWAELIDGAQFPDAKMAVELEEPALRLMTMIEAEKDAGVLHGLIGRLQHESLEQLASAPEYASRIEPLLARHQTNVELIRERSRLEGGVVFYDIADQGIDTVNKFIPYYLHPDCRYGVNVTASKKRAKVSIGSNPWAKVPRTHDLARLAEKFGGGGHPVVAAISFPPDALEKARAAAAEIAATLRGG